MWGPSTGAADIIFPEKKLVTFLPSPSVCQLSVSQFSLKTGDVFLLITLLSLGGRPFFRHAKICRSFCGGPFCGAPVRPNMLNMPKSAAGEPPSPDIPVRPTTNIYFNEHLPLSLPHFHHFPCFYPFSTLTRSSANAKSTARPSCLVGVFYWI